MDGVIMNYNFILIQIPIHMLKMEILVLKANVVPQGIGSSKGLRYYSSARFRTKGKGDWKYGRIDVKAKSGSRAGNLACNLDASYRLAFGGWPSSGEIDIMEHVGYDLGVEYTWKCAHRSL